MQVSATFHLDYPLDQVADVLNSEAFNVATQRIRDEYVSVEYVVRERSEQRLVHELHTVEYKRNKTGKLSRRKTFTSIKTSTWDPASSTLHWSYMGQLGRRARFEGDYRLFEEGQGTHLVHEVTVEVHIPLIGGAIAKAVARAFERLFPDFDRLLKAYLRRAYGPPAG
jgi:hypothetical protein